MSDEQERGSPPPSGLKEQKEETVFLDPKREGRESEGLDAREMRRLARAVGPPPPCPTEARPENQANSAPKRVFI